MMSEASNRPAATTPGDQRGAPAWARRASLAARLAAAAGLAAVALAADYDRTVAYAGLIAAAGLLSALPLGRRWPQFAAPAGAGALCAGAAVAFDVQFGPAACGAALLAVVTEAWQAVGLPSRRMWLHLSLIAGGALGAFGCVFLVVAAVGA
jgi:hypothetical protein